MEVLIHLPRYFLKSIISIIEMTVSILIVFLCILFHHPVHDENPNKLKFVKYMESKSFTGVLQGMIDKARIGRLIDVDELIGHLNCKTNLETTRYVDFALSQVETDEGVLRIRHYLFNGTQMQRNYASLFFNRRGNKLLINEAFEKGLIDEIQAFSR